jgi:hypothetical protein
MEAMAPQCQDRYLSHGCLTNVFLDELDIVKNSDVDRDNNVLSKCDCTIITHADSILKARKRCEMRECLKAEKLAAADPENRRKMKALVDARKLILRSRKSQHEKAMRDLRKNQEKERRAALSVEERRDEDAEKKRLKDLRIAQKSATLQTAERLIADSSIA